MVLPVMVCGDRSVMSELTVASCQCYSKCKLRLVGLCKGLSSLTLEKRETWVWIGMYGEVSTSAYQSVRVCV